MTPVRVDQDPDEGWDIVAIRLHQEISTRGLANRTIEREAGVSTPTIKKLLAGEPVRRVDRLAALAAYLGWRGDAFDRIRRGEEPEPADGGTTPIADHEARLADLERRVTAIEETVHPVEGARLRTVAEAAESGQVAPHEPGDTSRRRVQPFNPDEENR